MTVDEKQIGKKMYAIMTNAHTGRIAFLAQSMKLEELQQAVENYFSETIAQVKSVSCDMSPSYKKFCKDVFPNTQLVIDKFHVIKHLMEALQQVRKQIKIKCLTDDKTLAKHTIENNDEEEKIWSDIELLERSRYILCKMETDWEEDETEIMAHLFNKYPVLKTAYGLSQKLRLWYNGRNIEKHTDIIEQELYN